MRTLLLLALLASPAVAQSSVADLTQALQAVSLNLQTPRSANGLRLNLGIATLNCSTGVLYLAPTPGGGEVVFMGDARLEFDPPDPIEADQLRLFTGSPRLRAPVTAAVLTLNHDGAFRSLSARAPASTTDTQAQADELYASWRDGPIRRRLGVDGALLADALGDPFQQGYFAGRFDSPTLGRFLLRIDPNEAEQVLLGQFVPLAAEGRDERRITRHLHRQQRQGRLLGLEREDLGFWDTWVSTAFKTPKGQPAPGLTPFESRHYQLDVTTRPRQGELEGRGRLTLEALTGQRLIPLDLHRDLELLTARVDGQDLFTLRLAEQVLVVLPQAPEPGSQLELEVEWRGRFFEDGERRTHVLRDDLAWHPHVGRADLATYDVTLRWPRRLELAASGRLVEEGKDGSERWQRRRLDTPTWAFGFVLGRFERHAFDIPLTRGPVSLELLFDRNLRALDPKSTDELARLVADTLTTFDTLFGPYPQDHLTVVTVPRDYSQSLRGFVTLSHVMVTDFGALGRYLGLEDRRTVIAHEVAHQWWGHRVGWSSYRDQWIGEAMANYAANLWSRRRLPPSPLIGPTTGWRRLLTQALPDGRTLESTGPLVLGERLDSSRTTGTDAYLGIVYSKGAVVLDMLSRVLGEERFLSILREIVARVDGRALGTEDFFALMEALSGEDLNDFARRYVYGTGLPEVLYRLDHEPDPEGGHRVRITAEQQLSMNILPRIVKTKAGGLDVVRRVAQRAKPGRFPVPFHLQLATPEGVPSTVYAGEMVIEGGGGVLEFNVPVLPKGLVFDPGGQVFARFTNLNLELRLEGLLRGRWELLLGRSERALLWLESTLTQPVPRDLDATFHQLRTARLHLLRAEALLDLGRVDEAGKAMEACRRVVPEGFGGRLEEELLWLEGRREFLSGDLEGALERLEGPVLGAGRGGEEGALILALVARELGRWEVFERVVGEIGRGVASVDGLERIPGCYPGLLEVTPEEYLGGLEVCVGGGG